ncbi:hypothetical protein ACP70R_007696 [Stipagrostis hirtigluma subsp. patula]
MEYDQIYTILISTVRITTNTEHDQISTIPISILPGDSSYICWLPRTCLKLDPSFEGKMGANTSRNPAGYQRLNASAAAAGSGNGGSTSTISPESATGWHVLKVEGYSQTKGVLGVDRCICSGTFVVGGRAWRLKYFPDGKSEKSADYLSIFLHLDDLPSPNGGVRTTFKFSLLDHAGRPVSYATGEHASLFSSSSPSWGIEHFIKRNVLESSYLKGGDSFQIRCDLTVTEIRAPTTIDGGESPPPPSDLHRHLRELVASDMEARVFKAMLHFIYTDTLPEIQDHKIVITQHLLVAADRYKMQRLKLICEGMLLEHIDTSTVATTLGLAEWYGCAGLKEGCFRFLRIPGNMKMAMESDGFKNLRTSCPSVIEELLAEVAP